MAQHRFTNWKQWLLSVFSVILLSSHFTSALYEDQIKKFDWRKLQIGTLRQAYLELNAFQPRLLASTHENVIASLCPKTGDIIWRQVLESGSRGDLKLFHVTSVSGRVEDGSSTAAARLNSKHSFDMLTVQGHAPALVRGWNSNTGHIEWEWSLMPVQANHAEGAFWFYSHSLLYHVLPVWGSHLEVTQYFATTGHATGSTSKIMSPWINEKNCKLSGSFYTCQTERQLISLDLSNNAKTEVLKKTLESTPKQIKALEGANGVFVIDNHLVSVSDDNNACNNLESNAFIVGQYNQRRIIAAAGIKDKMLQINAYYMDSCERIEELSNVVAYPEHHGKVISFNAIDCKQKRVNDGKGCLFVLKTADEAILAIQQGKIRWTREEALANVIAVEFMDLPLADTEGTLENEIKGNKADDIVSAFMRRITAQIHQVKAIFLHVVGLGVPPTDTQKAGIVRDAFGLHKMLVVLTRSGKIFGIDNISGKLHWQWYLPEAENFENNERMRLIVQRTSKHFPLQPLCTVIAKDKENGNGLIFRFNPITGKPAEGGLLKLNFQIKQLALLAETETDFTKGILLIDPNNRASVYPESSKKMADGLYMFTADKKTAKLNGFIVKHRNGKLSTTSLWNADLCGPTCDQQIIEVAMKNPIERVHSQGRVLGDRSVLYKYINPNLVAVFLQAPDNIHKYILNVHLVDVVSGMIIFSMTHRKVRAPLHVVHSENWLIYSYYNEKNRRTEITTVELYEGKTQANSSVWSSLNAPPMPLIERQSYIIPTIVQAMQETITERGITNKHVLIGTASGAIVEMPWALLDPRRPIASTTQGREEGAIPYIPELPLPTENIINYNQTIARLRDIYTAPSGLESTCLVVATGLDIFVTRVAPSKTFDILKEDFDYILITTVLIALTSSSLIVKHLASRKLLKQAWK